MDSIGKLYNFILCTRLEKWFKPDREQAGAQQGRGCMEHIVTLRLLMDYAVYKKKKLYVLYVDFSKAYDRVPRHALLETLRRLGCGAVMLYAIYVMYSSTQLIFGTAIITAAIGVRQGSPTSCLLFTLYVNGLIRDLKLMCEPDGFLSWLHCLMLMDDTIIFASNRDAFFKKVKVLVRFCKTTGMVINDDKTKFMVVNGAPEDMEPIHESGIIIKNCDSYTYLGSLFLQNGRVKSAIAAQCKAKGGQLLKYRSFVTKNSDLPFWAKKKVLDSALLTSVFYACESWLCKSLDAAQTLHMTGIKSLLGVRTTTPNDPCLIEVGYTSASGMIRGIQKKFFHSMFTKREGMEDDPFMKAWDIARQANTPCARYIKELLDEDDPPKREFSGIQDRVRSSTKTKASTYTEMNPRLEVHKVYTVSSQPIPEHYRLAFTQIRLGAHSLAIETGRWSRIPREQRLCECGEVQTENHILARCEKTEDIRSSSSNIECFSIPNLFENNDIKAMCYLCYKCLHAY